jgi:hypothetical protein
MARRGLVVGLNPLRRLDVDGYPGCPHPSKGPRFSFLCDTHGDLSKAEKRKFMRRKACEAS